jgi:hypothetical protein
VFVHVAWQKRFVEQHDIALSAFQKIKAMSFCSKYYFLDPPEQTFLKASSGRLFGLNLLKRKIARIVSKKGGHKRNA